MEATEALVLALVLAISLLWIQKGDEFVVAITRVVARVLTLVAHILFSISGWLFKSSDDIEEQYAFDQEVEDHYSHKYPSMPVLSIITMYRLRNCGERCDNWNVYLNAYEDVKYATYYSNGFKKQMLKKIFRKLAR